MKLPFVSILWTIYIPLSASSSSTDNAKVEIPPVGIPYTGARLAISPTFWIYANLEQTQQLQKNKQVGHKPLIPSIIKKYTADNQLAEQLNAIAINDHSPATPPQKFAGTLHMPLLISPTNEWQSKK